MRHVEQQWPLSTLRRSWCNALFICLLFIGLSVALGACETTPKSTAPPPARQDETVRVEPDLSKTAKNISIDPLLPPGADARPARAGETGRPRTAEGLPILDPKGIKADQLFTEVIKDPDRRMARLENAVVEIRKDLDAAMPAINRLVAIEGDIQDLVGQLQILLNDNQPLGPDMGLDGASIPPIDLDAGADGTTRTFGADDPVPQPPVLHDKKADHQSALDIAGLGQGGMSVQSQNTAPVRPLAKPILDAQTPAVKPLAAPVPASASTIKLSGIRVGEHNDKVRIVIDTAKPITMQDDLDLTEKLLVLDVAGVDVENARATQAPNAVVDAISLRSTGAGAGQAVLELKRDTKILKTSTLPPTAENPNYRTVIDLAK
jgi:hypothetical protein